jgi:hypothetical protein
MRKVFLGFFGNTGGSRWWSLGRVLKPPEIELSDEIWLTKNLPKITQNITPFPCLTHKLFNKFTTSARGIETYKT